MEEKKLTWKQLPQGDVLEAGTSLKFKTGNWRSIKPVHIPEKCINCLICWMACPDMAVKTKDDKFSHFDYDFCKGCGICAHECPTEAIKMEKEGK
jgi:pyruvate ferredoxin oxidoreductase delta subunit